jgi:hypothetical protein
MKIRLDAGKFSRRAQNPVQKTSPQEYFSVFFLMGRVIFNIRYQKKGSHRLLERIPP